MTEAVEEMTPLKKKLEYFGNFLSKIIAAICILVFLINIRHFGDAIHGNILKGAIYYFKIAVALAVAAIPEGLPAVVTTCLALGTRRMARHNAIVRNLPSVETLGCTTVICSDKTGTLTTNNMSVVRMCMMSEKHVLREFEVSGHKYSPEGVISDGNMDLDRENPSDAMCYMAMCASLCNEASISYDHEKHIYKGVGESLEIALRFFVEKVIN